MKPQAILLTLFLLASTGCSTNMLAGDNAPPKGVDLYVAGVQAYQAGDRKLAQSRLEQAVNVNPKLRMAHSMLGDIYRADGDYERAREQYSTLISLDPYGADNYYRLGVTYQFLQRIEDAIGSYLRALNIQPKDMKSSMNLGLCFLSLNQRDDAVKYLRRATELSPTWSDAWMNLGVAQDAAGDYPAAERSYRRAIELNRNQIPALLNLAANLIRQNKGNEAVTVMEEVIKRNDNPANRTRYGRSLAMAKRFDDAMLQYQLALKVDPRYYPACNERAATYILQYEKGLELDDRLRLQAIDAWQESLQIYSNQPPVRAAIKQWGGGKLFN